jgi:hypothetical protein
MAFNITIAPFWAILGPGCIRLGLDDDALWQATLVEADSGPLRPFSHPCNKDMAAVNFILKFPRQTANN